MFKRLNLNFYCFLGVFSSLAVNPMIVSEKNHLNVFNKNNIETVIENSSTEKNNFKSFNEHNNSFKKMNDEIDSNFLITLDYEKIFKEFQKKIPVLMFHNFDEKEDRYTINFNNFEKLLQELYYDNFYSVSLEEFIKGDFSNVPIGKKPILLTFDDAGTGQFLINKDYSINKNSAVGILEDFYKKNDFGKGGVFFISYGSKNDFQLPFKQQEFASYKLKFLINNGYDLAHHTVFHPNNENAIINNIFEQNTLSSALFHYLLEEDYNKIKVKAFAHPFGSVPKKKQVFDYLCENYDLIFNAWGGTSSHPLSNNFKNYEIPRIEITYQTKHLILNASNLYEVTPETKKFYLTRINNINQHSNNYSKINKKNKINEINKMIPLNVKKLEL